MVEPPAPVQPCCVHCPFNDPENQPCQWHPATTSALTIRTDDTEYWLHGPGFIVNLDVNLRGPIVAGAIRRAAGCPVPAPASEKSADEEKFDRFYASAMEVDAERDPDVDENMDNGPED